ncbi:unnamed protein product, partial [Discosporangium mesarthrocarpum]
MEKSGGERIGQRCDGRVDSNSDSGINGLQQEEHTRGEGDRRIRRAIGCTVQASTGAGAVGGAGDGTGEGPRAGNYPRAQAMAPVGAPSQAGGGQGTEPLETCGPEECSCIARD